MDILLGSKVSASLGDSLTVLSSAGILNSGYKLHRLQAGQFKLPQPWQTPSAAGSKRKQNGLPKQQQQQQQQQHGVTTQQEDASQQEQQQHVQTISRAHQQLLAAVTAACSGPAATAAAAPAEQPPSSTLLAAASHQLDKAADEDTANVQFTDPAAEQVTQPATDWTVLAGMKHALKPKLHFHYSNTQGQLQTVHSKLFDAFICNPSSSEVLATAYDRHVLLPAGCGFCMSDLKAMQPFVTGETVRVNVCYSTSAALSLVPTSSYNWRLSIVQ
jgi:hypothetical protein